MKSKIKLSAQDKGLVSMWWLHEIVAHGVKNINYSDAPEDKKGMYEELRALATPAHMVAREVNDAFNDEINKVFGEEYQSLLADVSIAIVTLLNDFRPEQVKKIIRAAGITDKQIFSTLAKKDSKDGKTKN